MAARESLVVPSLAGYSPEVGTALWRLEDARSRTLRLLSDVPDSLVDRPTEGNTIGTILYHIALIEADWLFTEILQQPPPSAIAELLPVDHRDAAGVLSLVSGQTTERHLSRLSAIRNTLMERLREMPADDFDRVRTLADYDVSPAWVLHHLAQHEAEHRGELGSVVARLKEGG